MPLETKDVLSYLNIEGVDNLDQFKEKFDPEFVRKAQLKDVKSEEYKEIYTAAAGKLLGTVRSNFVSIAKKYGAEFKPEETERDVKFEDIMTVGLDRVKESYEKKLQDLQIKVGQPDEVAKQWEDKYKKLESKAADTEKLLQGLQETNKNLQTTFDTEKGTWANQVKSIKLDTIVAKDREKIKWNTAAKPLEKTGFFADFEKNYKLDLDENSNLEIFTSKGERIPHHKVCWIAKSTSAHASAFGTRVVFIVPG